MVGKNFAPNASFQWNWRMLLITGESRFADLMELTLFNSILAGISLDGSAFFYTNTLRNLDPMPVEEPKARAESAIVDELHD